MHAFGAHFYEVHVIPELGTVRVTRWVNVMSTGRILNPKTACSQVIGGGIFGIGAALMDASIRDIHLACYVNASLADYHVPGNADIPAMTSECIDEHVPLRERNGRERHRRNLHRRRDRRRGQRRVSRYRQARAQVTHDPS
jgi:xanthine dehydrogenase YagR molybdenum-binding subunit